MGHPRVPFASSPPDKIAMTTRKTDAAAKTPAPEGEPLISLDSALFSGVDVRLDAQLGSLTMTVEELLRLKAGEVVTLDSRLNDLVELQINGARVARGEIVAVNDSFGVRIVEISDPS